MTIDEVVSFLQFEIENNAGQYEGQKQMFDYALLYLKLLQKMIRISMQRIVEENEDLIQQMIEDSINEND